LVRQPSSAGGRQINNLLKSLDKGEKIMKPFLVGSFIIFVVSAWAGQPPAFQRGPKNLMSPTYRAPVAQAVVPQELTWREVKQLTATAESAAEHLKLASYYQAKADKFNAQGAGYEQAAATYRHGPMVKNLMAPTTPGRYEFFAKGFRDEAKSNRSLAAAHEEMAKDVSAGL
jgi:hypothetical protein